MRATDYSAINTNCVYTFFARVLTGKMKRKYVYTRCNIRRLNLLGPRRTDNMFAVSTVHGRVRKNTGIGDDAKPAKQKKTGSFTDENRRP